MQVCGDFMSEDNHFPCKRLPDGSKRIRVPHLNSPQVIPKSLHHYKLITQLKVVIFSFRNLRHLLGFYSFLFFTLSRHCCHMIPSKILLYVCAAIWWCKEKENFKETLCCACLLVRNLSCTGFIVLSGHLIYSLYYSDLRVKP